MHLGGNMQCVKFLCHHGVKAKDSIRYRYSTAAGRLYQKVLEAEYNGKSEPTSLTDVEKDNVERAMLTFSSTQQQNIDGAEPIKKKMKGFGSSPPPSSRKGRSRRRRHHRRRRHQPTRKISPIPRGLFSLRGNCGTSPCASSKTTNNTPLRKLLSLSSPSSMSSLASTMYLSLDTTTGSDLRSSAW